MKLRLDAFGSALGYAYVLRMPLVIWLGILALPLVAVPKGAALGPLLRGLFDLTDPLERGVSIGAFEQRPQPVSLLSHGVEAWSFALVTLASLMVVASIGITARLILLDGADRFNMHRVRTSPGIEVALRLLLGLPPLLIVGAALKQSADTFSSLAFMVAGIVAGVAAFARGLVPLQRAVWTRVFDEDGSKRPATALTWPIHASLRLFELVIAQTPSGFVAADGRLRSRHVFAWFQMLASVLLYLIVFLLKWDWLPLQDLVRIPTLCLVLMLAMIAGWILGAMSFLLDRFRIPVITLLVAYGTLMSVFPQGDHFFDTVKPPTPAPRTIMPPQVLGRRAGQPAIAVSAMGGGIHAGAWVARVLAGLQIDSMRCGTDFDRALSVISSVSGGSMGAMYIVDAYKDGRLTDEKALSDAVKASEGSSLDDVAWALTYPDLAWTLFPFAKGIWLRPPALFTGPNLVLDRGTALEDSWKRTTPLETRTLDDWRKDVAAHQRPAVIFNSTVVETGERMLLGTTTIDGKDKDTSGRVDFGLRYPGSDVLVVTAARLSSTFPYVSPPARIEPDGRFAHDFHMVDGGYYDNYGTQTLVEWLAHSLDPHSSDENAKPPSRLLLLEIRTFPPASARNPDARRGWIFEATHPLVTLAAVRTSAQLSTAEVMAGLLRRAGKDYVRTLSLGFPSRVPQDVDDVSPALSWHLTPRDRGRLRDAWNDPETKRARAVVQRFLANDSFTEDAVSHCIH
jgi:Patatin-like phospholipase